MLFLLPLEYFGKLFFGGRFVLYEISLRLKSGEHFVLRIIQRFHDFMGYESNGLKSRQQYEGYEVVTKEFLAQNLNQRILVAGVKGSCRVKTYDKYRYMYMPKYYKTRGFIFKMTELVKSIK